MVAAAFGSVDDCSTMTKRRSACGKVAGVTSVGAVTLGAAVGADGRRTGAAGATDAPAPAPMNTISMLRLPWPARTSRRVLSAVRRMILRLRSPRSDSSASVRRGTPCLASSVRLWLARNSALVVVVRA